MDTATSNPPSGNELEDVALGAALDEFQVIGLRPAEYRPAVIRRAMHRSAMALASLYSNQTDRGIEERLARVITSGYRLLDPRRREDSIQRMMLGRIHPQLAEEAARMAQSKGQSLFASEADNVLEFEPFIEGSLLKNHHHGGQRKAHLPGESYFVTDTDNRWSDSLRSRDLLLEPAYKKWIRISKRWITRRDGTVATTAGFLFVTLATWWAFRDAPQHPAALLSTKVAVADAALKSSQSSPADEGSTELKPEPSVAEPDFQSLEQIDDVLLGRVIIDGKDAGILVAYEADASLSEESIISMTGEVDDSSSVTRLELCGTIELDAPGTIQFFLPLRVADSIDSISIDDCELEALDSPEGDRSTRLYRANLPAGFWTIRLSVSPQVGKLPLRIVDAQTGLPVGIKRPLTGIKSNPLDLPTRVRVAVRSGA